MRKSSSAVAPNASATPAAMRRILCSISAIVSRLKAARGAANHGALGDDVIGLAGMELGQAKDGGVDRPDIARHDRLQRNRDVARGNDRVDPGFGACAVRAAAGHGDVERRRTRPHRPGTELKFADAEPRPIVHAKDRIARESGRTGRRRPSPRRRRAPPRPAERSGARCRRNCASRRDSAPPRAASPCARHDRRRASAPDSASGRGGWSPPRSATQSISARNPIECGELPARNRPTTPVLPMPRNTSTPNSASLCATRSAKSAAPEAKFGMGVDVMPPFRQFVRGIPRFAR